MSHPLLLLVLAAPGVALAAADPLQSPACHEALAALDAHEAWAAAPSRQDAARERGAALRERAARACLQSRTDAPTPEPQHLAQPPQTVPLVALPPVTVLPPPTAVLPAQNLPTPVPRVLPPANVTACDDAGCWSSDGMRLQHAGPNLPGPRGLCSAAGGLLQCP